MADTNYYQTSVRSRRSLHSALCMALALFTCACAAATRPPNAAGPNPNAPPYPVLLIDAEGTRHQAALTGWASFIREQGIQNAPEPELQPVTSTIRSLPKLAGALYLPKVGEGLPMTEEETREALRRFINENHELLGIEPQQLSLVQRTDAADGTKRARYEQRPFRYPFRNGYGIIEITFAPDRRILEVTSTAIPDIERLRVAGAGIAQRSEIATAELAAKAIVGRTVSYTDEGGRTATYTINGGEEIEVREMVIYPKLRTDEPPALEFHLAWEIALKRAPVRAIYLDAITKEVIGATVIAPAG